MKKLGLILVWLLSLVTLSVFFLGASMMGQKDEDSLLLFVKREDTGEKLYIFNANTGEQRFVSNLAENSIVDWLSDNRIWILDAGDYMENGSYPLRLLDAQNGSEITVGDAVFYWGCGDTISWSPNGEQIAYLKQEQDELFIQVLNLSTGSTFQLPAMPHGGRLLPDWSDDGNYIILNHFRTNSSARLLRASDGQEVLATPYYFGFSPDNQYVAYADASFVYLYQLATGTTIATGAKIELGSNNSFYSDAQWSPSGRYIIAELADSPNELIYYDMESASLHTIDFGKPIQFMTWTSDEAQILAHTDFFDASFNRQPASILSYNLSTEESTALLTDVNNMNYWSRTYRNGDWLLIPYTTSHPKLSEGVDLNAVTSNLFFLNGQEQHDFDLLVGDWWDSHDIYSLGNERGFIIDGGDDVYHEAGLYYFDSQDSNLELIDADYGRLLLPSPDGHYLIYGTWSDEQEHINIWNSESQTSNHVFEAERSGLSFIGWRGNSERQSYQVCPES
jgi:Tol biopolymer transport system component